MTALIIVLATFATAISAAVYFFLIRSPRIPRCPECHAEIMYFSYTNQGQCAVCGAKLGNKRPLQRMPSTQS